MMRRGPQGADLPLFMVEFDTTPNKGRISMHGTFPETLPKRASPPETEDSWTGFGISFAFASLPLVLATLVAIFRFGSKVTLADIVDTLVTATSAAPM